MPLLSGRGAGVGSRGFWESGHLGPLWALEGGGLEQGLTSSSWAPAWPWPGGAEPGGRAGEQVPRRWRAGWAGLGLTPGTALALGRLVFVSSRLRMSRGFDA